MIDLSKQELLGSDPKALHEISFTGNIESDEKATMFFINEEVKETQIYHQEL